MSVKIYDASIGAFKDASTPLIWDEQAQAYKDSVGLVWNESARAWEERWGGSSRYDLITNGIWNNELGNFSMRHVYSDGTYSASNVLTKSYSNNATKYEMHGLQSQQFSMDVPLNSPTLPIKKIKKVFIDAGAYGNIGSNIQLAFVNKEKIVNIFNSTYNGQLYSITKPVSMFNIKSQTNSMLDYSPCQKPLSYGWENIGGDNCYAVNLYSGSSNGARAQIEIDLGDGIDLGDCIPCIFADTSGVNKYYSYLWLYNLILYG